MDMIHEYPFALHYTMKSVYMSRATYCSISLINHSHHLVMTAFCIRTKAQHD